MINYEKSSQKINHNIRGSKRIVPNVNTIIYGSNSITLKAIKQWNELQNFIRTDIFSPEMTSFKLLKSIKTYIEKQ